MLFFSVCGVGYSRDTGHQLSPLMEEGRNEQGTRQEEKKCQGKATKNSQRKKATEERKGAQSYLTHPCIGSGKSATEIQEIQGQTIRETFAAHKGG